jgi:MFS transporter, PPP family, 3-phenylpropionic acid transporter
VTHGRLKFFYFSYLAALGGFSPFFGPFVTARGFNEWQLSVLMSVWYGARMLAPNLWDLGVSRAAYPIYWLRAGALATLLFTALFIPLLPFWGMVMVMVGYAGVFNALMPQFEALTLQHLAGQPERYSGIRLYGSIGFLLVVLGFGALFRELDIRLLMWVMLPLTLLLIWASFTNDYPSNRQAKTQRTALKRGRLASWKRVLTPSMWAILWIGLCNQVAHGPLYVYFSVYLLGHGFDALQVGLLWALSVVCEIAAFTLMRGVLKRYSLPALVGVSLLVGALRWLAIGGFPDSGWVIAIAQCTHALTFAVMHAVCMQTIAQGQASVDFGRAQALFYSVASGAGGVVSALIAGGVWNYFGDQFSFYVAAGFSLLALLGLPWLRVHPGAAASST